jgi:hypothetical protein
VRHKLLHQFLTGNIRQTEVVADQMCLAQTGAEITEIENNYFFVGTLAVTAAERPAGPPPMIAMSYKSVITSTTFPRNSKNKRLPVTTYSNLLSLTSQIYHLLFSLFPHCKQ